MKKLLTLLVVSFCLAPTAIAQGNAEAGKTKSATCAACHGADGNSLIAMNPKLAGQHPKYLEKQLNDFKLAAQSAGKEGRNNPVMNGMAMGLSDQDIADLAAYYADQKGKDGKAPEEVVAKGTTLYRGGDMERGITSCIACHGPRGNGSGLSGFPDISGQHADYTKSQLLQFRDGKRGNDLNGMMRDISKRLTDEDIEILSQYLSGLH